MYFKKCNKQNQGCDELKSHITYINIDLALTVKQPSSILYAQQQVQQYCVEYVEKNYHNYTDDANNNITLLILVNKISATELSWNFM